MNVLVKKLAYDAYMLPITIFNNSVNIGISKNLSIALWEFSIIEEV